MSHPALTFTERAVLPAQLLLLQPAHELAEQELQEEPEPAITPRPLLTAEKSERARRVLALPHAAQSMGASASAIARRLEKRW